MSNSEEGRKRSEKSVTRRKSTAGDDVTSSANQR